MSEALLLPRGDGSPLCESVCNDHGLLFSSNAPADPHVSTVVYVLQIIEASISNLLSYNSDALAPILAAHTHVHSLHQLLPDKNDESSKVVDHSLLGFRSFLSSVNEGCLGTTQSSPGECTGMQFGGMTNLIEKMDAKLLFVLKQFWSNQAFDFS